MATMKVEGFDDVAAMFGQLGEVSGPMAKMAVYDGAKVMADEIKRETRRLPAEKPRWLNGGDRYAVIVRQDREDLEKHLGITRIHKEASGTRAAIGFAGYGAHKTKKYKRGLPMAMIARSLNKGTSVREQSQFTVRAVDKAEKEAEEAMEHTINRVITKIIAE